jgi:hypothetical protein
MDPWLGWVGGRGPEGAKLTVKGSVRRPWSDVCTAEHLENMQKPTQEIGNKRYFGLL